MQLYIIAALVMIGVDQLVKVWAATELKAVHTIPILKDVFHFTYVENRGAAFSMFAKHNSQWIFVMLAMTITVAIFIALKKGVLQTKMGQCSVVMIAAGAVGNAIDRLIRGFVVDMFDFCLIHFPVFNIADIFICVGGLLFIIYFVFQHKDREDSNNNNDIAVEKRNDE